MINSLLIHAFGMVLGGIATYRWKKKIPMTWVDYLFLAIGAVTMFA